MSFAMVKISTIMLVFTAVCCGFRLPDGLQEDEALISSDDDDSIPNIKAIIPTTETDAEVVLADIRNLPKEENVSTSSVESEKAVVTENSDEMMRRIDTGPVQMDEGRQIKTDRSEGFTNGQYFDTDRTGLLFGLFPFLGGTRLTGGRSHGPPRPPPSYRPNIPYKQLPHPTSQHIPTSPFKLHELDHGSHKPDPLPPFPPDGPIFGDYMADLPEISPPHFSHHELGDFKIPDKPQYSSDQKGFDDGFDFDFDPPDFFEHSGFQHPPEEDYLLQHDEPYLEGDADDIHPIKPYSNDDKFEFFPLENFDGFSPIIYSGPPKPIKHIPPGPKPGPPLPPPHKFMHPPDLNMIVEENIYRDDVPFKDIHNDRDKITDDLDDGGINGLDPETLDFIQTHTRPYVEFHSEEDDY